MKTLSTFAALKLSYYLKDKVQADVFETYKRLLDASVTQAEIDMICDLEQCPDESCKSAPVNIIAACCGDNSIAHTFVQLELLYYMDHSIQGLLSLIDPECVGGVSLAVASKVAGYKGEIYDYLAEIKDAYKKLELLFLFDKKATDPFRECICVDGRLVDFLMGDAEPDAELRDYCCLSLGESYPVYGFNAQIETLGKRLLHSSSDIVVQISGEKESGRYTHAVMAARQLGIQLLSVDFEFLLKTEQPRRILRKLVRECMLLSAGLCIRDVIRKDATVYLIQQIEKEYKKYIRLPLFILTRPEVKLIPFINGEILSVSIPKCTTTQSCEIWRGYLECNGLLEGIQIEDLASKMNLTAGQIKRVVGLFRTECELQNADKRNELIYRLCYQVLDDGRYDNVKRISSGFRLEDVKMNERNRRILVDICNQVTYRQKVYDDWSMSEKYTYGRCVSALFAGPPGTGKTMAVHALSSELGLELYKVDLSQVVDKYIGETQKRLEEIFARAEKSNMILFFDEADAIMGKRNEVKDSHDKYANTEIAYILQRMEEYDGIVILATNYLQNIDTAFMRRIRYVVNFESPDVETREKIWRSAFSKDVPVSDDLDFGFLAEKFEYAGGNIKNIVLNAVFYAAAENRAVDMSHIIKAIYRENTKDKQVAFMGDFGPYAYLQQDW